MLSCRAASRDRARKPLTASGTWTWEKWRTTQLPRRWSFFLTKEKWATVSVWRSVGEIRDYTFNSEHGAFLQRAAEWFEKKQEKEAKRASVKEKLASGPLKSVFESLANFGY